MEHSAEEYSIVMATNLERAYHLSLLSHPLLKASGSGSIVFISSVAGVVALFSGPIYGMTKGNRYIIIYRLFLWYLHLMFEQSLFSASFIWIIMFAHIFSWYEPISKELSMRVGKRQHKDKLYCARVHLDFTYRRSKGLFTTTSIDLIMFSTRSVIMWVYYTN